MVSWQSFGVRCSTQCFTQVHIPMLPSWFFNITTHVDIFYTLQTFIIFLGFVMSKTWHSSVFLTGFPTQFWSSSSYSVFYSCPRPNASPPGFFNITTHIDILYTLQTFLIYLGFAMSKTWHSFVFLTGFSTKFWSSLFYLMLYPSPRPNASPHDASI